MWQKALKISGSQRLPSLSLGLCYWTVHSLSLSRSCHCNLWISHGHQTLSVRQEEEEEDSWTSLIAGEREGGFPRSFFRQPSYTCSLPPSALINHRRYHGRAQESRALHQRPLTSPHHPPSTPLPGDPSSGTSSSLIPRHHHQTHPTPTSLQTRFFN